MPEGFGFNTGNKWMDRYLESYSEILMCTHPNPDIADTILLPLILDNVSETEGTATKGDHTYAEEFWDDYFLTGEMPALLDNIDTSRCDIDAVLNKWGYGAKDEITEGSSNTQEIGNNKNQGNLLTNNFKAFKNKFADKITNFNPTTDTLEIDVDSFGINGSATFTSGKNKKIVKKKLAKQDFNFLYDEKKGGLYFNENGSDKGFGNGGIIAILKGAPDLTSDNLEFS